MGQRHVCDALYLGPSWLPFEEWGQHFPTIRTPASSPFLVFKVRLHVRFCCEVSVEGVCTLSPTVASVSSLPTWPCFLGFSPHFPSWRTFFWLKTEHQWRRRRPLSFPQGPHLPL